MLKEKLHGQPITWVTTLTVQPYNDEEGRQKFVVQSTRHKGIDHYRGPAISTKDTARFFQRCMAHIEI